jgi:hypothetical protein
VKHLTFDAMNAESSMPNGYKIVMKNGVFNADCDANPLNIDTTKSYEQPRELAKEILIASTKDNNPDLAVIKAEVIETEAAIITNHDAQNKNESILNEQDNDQEEENNAQPSMKF